MYEGHNIDCNMPNLETVEIREQLTRYENKEDINQSDVEFHELVKSISERKEPTELKKIYRQHRLNGNRRLVLNRKGKDV